MLIGLAIALICLLICLLTAMLAALLTRALIGAHKRRPDWAVFYLKGCKACDRQKLILENNQMRVPYVECADTSQFPYNQIPAFPFWYNRKTEQFRVGCQTF